MRRRMCDFRGLRVRAVVRLMLEMAEAFGG
jgi:hypothetical protein